MRHPRGQRFRGSHARHMLAEYAVPALLLGLRRQDALGSLLKRFAVHDGAPFLLCVTLRPESAR
jgi:hypothetical protein